MNLILNVLPNFVKAKVGQCSIAKGLWEKLHNLYSTKQSGPDVNENSDPSEYDEQGLTTEEFSEEIKLIKELKAHKICSNTLEEQVQGLKIEVEEHKCIEESHQNKLEEINNTATRYLKREVQQKQQELDTVFVEISRITQQMQEEEIERKEFDQRYISVVDQKQKEL